MSNLPRSIVNMNGGIRGLVITMVIIY